MDASKRWSERFILYYTPVWIAAVVVVMATHAFTHWGDVGHLFLGVGLVAPLYVAPLLAHQGRDAHIWKFNLWIGLYSILQTYFGSALFFDVLHMEYHFPVHWIWNRTPIFLYLMTITYFSTYYVAMSLVWRRAVGKHWLVRALVLILLGYAVAFAETAGMANEWLKDYFIYRDKSFVLLWGSACYGSIFVLSLPFVFRLHEPERPSFRRIAGEVLAVNMAALIAYEGWTALLR